MTGRMLLDHPEVHAVAARNLVTIGRQTLGGDIRDEEVRDQVSQHFRTIGTMIDAKLPDVARVLNTVTLNTDQAKAVLHMMRYTSDPRVQQLGLEVAHAIRDADSDDPAILKLGIARRLAPRRRELQQLFREMIPPTQRAVFTGTGRGLEELLDPSRVKMLKTVGEGWGARLSGTSHGSTDQDGFARLLGMVPTAEPTQEEKLRTSQQVIGSIGAAAEEVNAIMRIIQPICEMFGKALHVPPLVTSALGMLDFTLEVTACALGAAADKNPMASVSCPMLSASAGFDALREIFTLLGLLDDENPENGINGNVDGGPTTWGVLSSNRKPLLG